MLAFGQEAHADQDRSQGNGLASLAQVLLLFGGLTEVVSGDELVIERDLGVEIVAAALRAAGQPVGHEYLRAPKALFAAGRGRRPWCQNYP